MLSYLNTVVLRLIAWVARGTEPSIKNPQIIIVQQEIFHTIIDSADVDYILQRSSRAVLIAPPTGAPTLI